MKKTSSKKAESPSALIDARIRDLDDWRGKTLARLRGLIKEAVPDVVEEWKWRGTPVWEHNGMICTGETYKNYVKMTFAKGASLKDPARLFNSSLEGNTRRAIDVREDDRIDEKALAALIRAAVEEYHDRMRSAGNRRPDIELQTVFGLGGRPFEQAWGLRGDVRRASGVQNPPPG